MKTGDAASNGDTSFIIGRFYFYKYTSATAMILLLRGFDVCSGEEIGLK